MKKSGTSTCMGAQSQKSDESFLKIVVIYGEKDAL